MLALQTADLSEDVLLLCDNEAVLRVIKKRVGQGGKATLATAPDADILQEIILLLTQRVCVFITAGPITKLCAWGRRIVEDMCYEIRRAEACVD